MLLPRSEVELFFKLHLEFLYFLIQQLNLIQPPLPSAVAIRSLSPDDRVKLSQEFVKNVGLIPAFVEQNPARMSEEELDIVRSWKHFVAGDFYVFRDLKNYTVFLSVSDSPVAYGVTSLSQEITLKVGQNLPRLTGTLLLPFKGKLIYDGLMNTHNMSFGPGVRRSLDELYREAKQRYGIVTTLPLATASLPTTTQTKTAKTKTASLPKPQPADATAQALAAIVALTNSFCHEHLSEEYANLCRRLAAKLGRKLPSPLIKGKPSSWACGIVRVIARYNYLEDNKLPRPLTGMAINHVFGVSQGTGHRLITSILKLLRIGILNTDFVLPDRVDKNPMVAWERTAIPIGRLLKK